MEENTHHSPTKKEAAEPEATRGGGGGGWGGWAFSGLSVFSDLQKAAAVAAEEISRNAVEVAKNAAKSIEDMNILPDSESSKEGEEVEELSAAENPDDDDGDGDGELLKSTLDKLEKASEDSLLGQGLKVLDSSVENLASGAWQAFGSAWKGGSNLVQKLESSAANFAGSIQQSGIPETAGSAAPSLLETGKAFTAKGMQVLERVGKETIELLITETGIEVEKNSRDALQDDEQLAEEVTFDRCFYIYGGPEQMEELEALSSHYALLFNRRKAKLSSEQKSFYDGKLREVQQIFSFYIETDGSSEDSDKGKKVETLEEAGDEMKILRDSSVNKAADMAAGFTTILAGLAADEINQRTSGRLETIHSEGVHRLSELCCFAVSQLLMLGKSIISNSNKAPNKDGEQDCLKINWPEDSAKKAKIIRWKAQSMAGDIQAVSSSFVMGISDIVEAYQAAMKGASTDVAGSLPQTSIQEKANAISDNIHADRIMATDKIQDGLRNLAYLVLSNSMPTA